MSPMSKISDDEFEMIRDYLDSYTESGLHVTVPYILREWNEVKEPLFTGIFNGNLILKRPVRYTASTTEIVNLIYEAVDNNENVPFAAKRFPLEWREFCNRKYIENSREVCWLYLSEIINYDNIVEGRILNICDFVVVHLPKPDGSFRDYRITGNTKPLRAVGRILKAFSDSGISEELFQSFCAWVSTFMTSKEISGNLCLSIHPLDYMTMSDNASNWSSCMSWEDNGCYRGGTVEMMNSPMVVVAYLEASTPMRVFGHDWNNKKWRTLILVDPGFVCSVKAYPYQNDHLTQVILDWINELSNGEYDENTFEVRPWKHLDIPMEGEDEKEIHLMFEPRCDRMYNDFGSTTHWMKVSKSVFEDMIQSGEEVVFDFNYSGVKECMTCGELDANFSHENDEEALSCLNCYDPEPTYECAYCGDTYHEDDMLWVDEECYCPYCAEDPNIIALDSVWREYCRAENVRTVKFINSKNEEKVLENVSMRTLMRQLDRDKAHEYGINYWRIHPDNKPIIVPIDCIKEPDNDNCYWYEYRCLIQAIGKEFAEATSVDDDQDVSLLAF